jgi:hypothetical protein
VSNAGSVTLSGLPRSAGDLTCASVVLSQGHGLNGKAEAGDAVGQAVGGVSGDPGLEEDRFDSLLIGAPGEGIGTGPNGREPGRATLWNRRTPSASLSFGYRLGDRAGLQYSSVFGAEAG